MDPFIGQIILWPMNWAPQDWALCNGQLLNVAQNQALFSLLGTTYGGDGRTTFGLPNLQGRFPLGYGVANGVTYQLGQTGGNAAVTLTPANLPAHTHPATFTPGSSAVTVQVSTNTTNGALAPSATNNYLGGTGPTSGPGQAAVWTNALTAPVPLGGVAGNISGTVTVNPSPAPTAAVPTLPPYQVLNYIIAVQGVYPQRP